MGRLLIGSTWRQPPLSRQIKALEAELRVLLPGRSIQRVDLTAAGERYLERAGAVLVSIDAAESEARWVQEGAVGHL